jgi:hypothetical protein
MDTGGGRRSKRRARSEANFPYPKTNPKPRKSDCKKIHDKAQLCLEEIYIAINSLWRQVREFPGTFSLPDFSDKLTWPAKEPPSRYLEAQEVLGDALLCLALHSDSFLMLLNQAPANEELWGQVLTLIKDSETSVGQFATTRNLDWFKDSLFENVVVPANWACPPMNHPHEVYQAEDASLKRCIFKNDYGASCDMDNITENIYDKEHWKLPLLKPQNWPEWQPFPGDPSIAPPDGYGPYGLCHGGCGEYTGISKPPCVCVAEKTYIHALIEVVQMLSWKPGELNRGVRAVARIKKTDYIGEYCGMYIPYEFNDLPRYGDSVYAFEWEPAPKFHPTSGRVVVDGSDDREPIATLIGGKSGTWAKFLNHRDDGEHNVEFVFVPIGGKMRIVVQAVKNIAAGEELMTRYGDLHFTRRSTRLQKPRKNIEKRRS